MNVAILGASNKEDRYSNMALKLLIEKGYDVYPVNPAYETIEGIRCYKKISDIKEYIDTLTVYMNSKLIEKIIPDIIAKKPARIIFNPGSESAVIEELLEKEGIQTIRACTLVMLNTEKF